MAEQTHPAWGATPIVSGDTAVPMRIIEIAKSRAANGTEIGSVSQALQYLTEEELVTLGYSEGGVFTGLDEFVVDGPLGLPYADYSEILGLDPGVPVPEVSGGYLYGANPETALMVLPGVEVDQMGVTIGDWSPNLSLWMLNPDDPTECHLVTIVVDSYNWATGPEFAQLFVGNFDDPIDTGDQIAMRVRGGTCRLLMNAINVDEGWQTVGADNDPLGASPLIPGISFQSVGNIDSLWADSTTELIPI